MQYAAAVGLDVGSVNVKCVLLGDRSAPAVERGAWCRASLGKPLMVAEEMLSEAPTPGASPREVRVAVTGSGKDLLPGVERVNEVVAVTAAVSASHPEVRTIIDVGGQFTKWILVSPPRDGRPGNVEDFALNGLCAAGSGAFLEQQAGRLKVDLEELGRLAAGAARGATIAGRCSVFAKSDMIHLQQKGAPVDEIAYGLCLALARTFVATVLKGRAIEGPVAIVGGGAANQGLVRAFAEVLGLPSGQIVVPADHLTVGARGPRWGGLEVEAQSADKLLGTLRSLAAESATIPTAIPGMDEAPAELAPLVRVEHDETGLTEDPSAGHDGPVRVFVGVDVGSVSTNVVLLDEQRELLLGIYLPTRGQPVDVLAEALARIAARFGEVEVLGVGTTGSGRYLAEQLLGADLVKNEITAQLVSAAHYVPEVDTIFEIGGQDSKYIDATGGRLRDFEMNKICAAGTGSFLEEQAERLGIRIKGEFSDHAFESQRPRDLGTRCTVFMDTELVRAQAQGTPVSDICAGLAYSVARNYLDKVVAGRPVGRTVMFQGGTASNQAVVAAFEQVLGRDLRVHPYNRISGAIGMALLAAREMERTGGVSKFHGLGSCREHTVSSFECKRCENRCQVNRVKAGGRTAHFGDVCERFTARDRRDVPAGEDRRAVDLFTSRADLLAAHLPEPGASGRPTVGLPRATFHLELLPLWAHLLDELGFEPVYTPPSTAKHLALGVRGLPSEVCLPLKLANGHIRQLIEHDKVDRVLMPTLLSLENRQRNDRPFVCPYAHELPFMARIHEPQRVLAPQVDLRDEPGARTQTARELAAALGVSTRKAERALRRGLEHQHAFEQARRALGTRRLQEIERGVVVLGKPYNLHDPFANLNLAKHLDRLGLAAIPMDLLPTADEVLNNSWYMVPWHLNREQMRAVKIMGRRQGLFPILVSNFGCGPDAFATKHLDYLLNDRPRLFLEFDEHRGEAGLVTRLEAFSDEISEYRRAGRHVHLLPHIPRPDFVREHREGPRRRCYVPNLYGYANVFGGALRAVGHDLVILPEPDEESARLGEEHSSGRECHPYTLIAGELVRLIRDRGLGPRDVFFVPGTRIPCLMPQYADGYRLLADKLGAEPRVWDPYVAEFMPTLGMHGMTRVFDGLTTVDFLIVLGCQLRPPERVPGSIDATMEACFQDVQDTIAEARELRDCLARCLERLSAVPVGPPEDRPLVGVTGDLYSRFSPIGNANLYQRLEAMGCTVWPSPFYGGSTMWETVGNAQKSAARGDVLPALREGAMSILFRARARRLVELVEPSLRELCLDPPAKILQDAACEYLGDSTLHLVRGIVAKMVDFSRRGADGVISAAGLNCMVGVSASAAIPAIRAAHGQIPMVAMSYGGAEGPSQRIQLETFVHQVRQRHATRPRTRS